MGIHQFRPEITDLNLVFGEKTDFRVTLGIIANLIYVDKWVVNLQWTKTMRLSTKIRFITLIWWVLPLKQHNQGEYLIVDINLYMIVDINFDNE